MKKVKTRNGGTMSEAEFFGKIRGSLRRTFRYWIPMKAALKKAERPSQSKNKRLKYEYQCNHCKKWWARKNVQIDHIIPCGSLRSFDDIVEFIKRLTAESIDSYQVLCEKCHLKKTQSDKLPL